MLLRHACCDTNGVHCVWSLLNVHAVATCHQQMLRAMHQISPHQRSPQSYPCRQGGLLHPQTTLLQLPAPVHRPAVPEAVHFGECVRKTCQRRHPTSNSRHALYNWLILVEKDIATTDFHRRPVSKLNLNSQADSHHSEL